MTDDPFTQYSAILKNELGHMKDVDLEDVYQLIKARLIAEGFERKFEKCSQNSEL